MKSGANVSQIRGANQLKVFFFINTPYFSQDTPTKKYKITKVYPHKLLTYGGILLLKQKNYYL
jgi:hypothetical protein